MQQVYPDNAIPLFLPKEPVRHYKELTSGGVDIVTSSLGEADSMVKAGLVKHMAIMSNENRHLSDVPLF